ncbi:MBOAT family O-acyltransferase [Butyrivibrio sp. VCB2006]|uniref:MBOAT family O-acyltransferase n=1 Tax=Butyrivibrio sp. VCB2006 TaxID=1280679 RepID=UPI0004224A48|nr:MBOAT family O-acyltransferase [Butyrivibrio sp. VCB2006]
MQVTSFAFLIFIFAVAALNYCLPRKFRYILLLIASLGFYASLDIKGLIVLVISILTTYGAGLLMDKGTANGSESGNGKSGNNLIFVLCIIVNVGMLAVFKYLGFFAGTVFGIMGKEAPAISILAPIGISFYILKALSYLIDVKRGTIKAERNIAKYALYVSFFTQIISGPIDRADNLIPQFNYPVTVDMEMLKDGFLQILWGYFMKLVLADRMAIFVGNVYDNPVTGTITFIGTLLYTLEIYCDFAGYSHIVIGSARLLGIDVMNNFDAPYLSKSIAEFWRRWHISLSSWLKDYIYIPLGGNRKGVARKYLNIIIVFAVSGLWHGANWTFVVWGLLHGLYQIVGFLLKPVRDFLVKTFKVDRESFAHGLVKTVITFLLVNLAWVFFRADTLAAAFDVIGKSLSFTPWVLTNGELFKHGLDQANMLLLAIGVVIVFVVDLMSVRGIVVREKILRQPWWLRWIIMIVAILVIAVCGIWGPGYDASSFIYQQF